jgi:GNAT superfamily N-acetyltransferase
MKIRPIETKDIKKVYDLIYALAVFEHMEDQFKNTEESLYDHVFNKRDVFVLVADECGQVVGFALYFYTYSTFVGKRGLYLEDIFIEEAYRSKGIAKMLFKALTEIARNESLERFEWTCLDWNTKALDIYKNMGAIQMNHWIPHRMTKEAMEAFLKTS